MTKFTQKMLFLLIGIVFSNAVSAKNWPIFSTKNMNQPYIKITQLLNSETKFYDDTYRYDIVLNESVIELLNVLISVSNTSNTKLIPLNKETEANENIYNIYLNDNEIGKIEMKRKHH